MDFSRKLLTAADTDIMLRTTYCVPPCSSPNPQVLVELQKALLRDGDCQENPSFTQETNSRNGTVSSGEAQATGGVVVVRVALPLPAEQEEVLTITLYAAVFFHPHLPAKFGNNYGRKHEAYLGTSLCSLAASVFFIFTSMFLFLTLFTATVFFTTVPAASNRKYHCRV